MKIIRFLFAPLFWLRDSRDELRKTRMLTAMHLCFSIEQASRVDRWPPAGECRRRLEKVLVVSTGKASPAERLAEEMDCHQGGED